MIHSIQAIDLHTHLNHGVAYDVATNELRKADLGFIRKMYNYTNIQCGAFSTFASVLSPECIYSENEYMYNLAINNDWIYQWVVIDPRKHETFTQAESMLSSPKCIGIKIHPSYHGYSLLEYADPLFSFADSNRATILTHPCDEAQFQAVANIADKYPQMNLIIAHLECKEHIEVIKHSKQHNIYTDTSGSASIRNNLIEYAVEQIGSEHILFGSDTYSCAFQRGRISYAMIPDKDKRNILRNNALKLFPKLLSSQDSYVSI